MEGYLKVKERKENLIIIEKSKFICYISGVEDEEDAKNFIKEIKKLNSLATHNCYAYIADDKGLIQKFSDDGEPQGTAGLPMLEVLKNKKLYKTCVVVTRYFGGIKLGTGGLTRAYGGSVTEILDKCKIVNMLKSVRIQIATEYDNYSKLLKLLNDNSKVVDTTFNNSVTILIDVKESAFDDFMKLLNDAFSGKLNIEVISKGYGEF